jgi:hypothetical protein
MQNSTKWRAQIINYRWTVYEAETVCIGRHTDVRVDLVSPHALGVKLMLKSNGA